MATAAKHDGTSLNDKLPIGPDLLNSLLGVLSSLFREQRLGLAAGIKAMFHQVHGRRSARPEVPLEDTGTATPTLCVSHARNNFRSCVLVMHGELCIAEKDST